MDLAAAEIELVEAENRVMKLETSSGSHPKNNTIISSSTVHLLWVDHFKRLNCCDTLLIPIQCEYYALRAFLS